VSSARWPVADVHALVRDVLEAAGAVRAVADSVAAALVLAECDGQGGHGLSRVVQYADQVASGKVDGRASPEIAHPRPATLLVDSRHGFAFPALDAALPVLAARAGAQGLAAAGFVRSHHFGVAGHPVERLARQGLVALAFTNAPAAIAPWGGTQPVFGTNPIAFAVPGAEPAASGGGDERGAEDEGGGGGERGDPVVVDLSLSKVARGKVNVAAQRGEAIPDDWALDADGRPTTDAKAAMAGSMRPAGDAKGAALAFMVEVLSAGLPGANFAFEASSLFDAEGPPPGLGHLILAIDPAGFGGHGFTQRLEVLLTAMTAQDGVRLPGRTRFRARAAAEREGLVLEQAFVDKLRARLA
jgi:(2R)-3-sulfolactate dehydrogenase (NADP+)